MKIVDKGYMKEELDYEVYKDFPKEGIDFIDITPSIIDAKKYKAMLKGLSKVIEKNPDLSQFDYIISPEARGFIYGSELSSHFSVGFIPMRKSGKLPEDKVYMTEYEKEYGTDTLCMLKSEKYIGKKILFVDDIYATGGTYQAAKELCKKAGSILAGGVVIATILDHWKEETDLYSLYEIKD